MRIGLVSDTHDNAGPVAAAVTAFRERGVTIVLHAGDVTRPDTLAAFAEWPGVVAFGNNDDARAIGAAAREIGWEAGDAWRGKLGDVCVGLAHGHRKGPLNRMLTKEKVDVLVRGHNHRQQDEVVDGVRVLNPGALYRARTYAVAVWDTGTGALERIPIPKK